MRMLIKVEKKKYLSKYFDVDFLWELLILENNVKTFFWGIQLTEKNVFSHFPLGSLVIKIN